MMKKINGMHEIVQNGNNGLVQITGMVSLCFVCLKNLMPAQIKIPYKIFTRDKKQN